MRHLSEIHVRFGDTDMLGHVNNASYFTYMEEARCDFLRALGVEQIPVILASAKGDFRAQTFYPEVLDVETWVTRMGNSSFEIANRMLRKGTDEVVFEGTAVVVHFDFDAQKPTRVPDALRSLLEPYVESALVNG
ncbi:thioesterase [Alicyclobacillus contaminans]|uniref:acyl-CoA thioesterase n=1 Tax=Alicyclobacillus contaminans TaxID=392016 RepID=UPI000479483D|nr:thioesterase family protein [Alicyclobacillus contaminans]GMA49460.1 thioesterase [Alicyclobacillus contaminans]